MKIGFVQVTSPEIESYAKHSTAINRRYCQRHGYTFIERPAIHRETHAPTWSKIFQALSVLEQGDYSHVFVLDADAVVLNPKVKLEDKISKMTTPIAFSENGPNGGDRINAGAFICTPDTIPYLEECIRISEEEHPRLKRDYWHEQSVMNLMHESGWKMDVWPMNEINSYWLHDYKNDQTQFIYHFMARSLTEKAAIAKELHWLACE